MSRDEMLKFRWKPYMIVHYEQPNQPDVLYEMIVIGVEFDDEAVHCISANPDYNKAEYYINIRFISIPDKKVLPLRKVVSADRPIIHTIL